MLSRALLSEMKGALEEPIPECGKSLLQTDEQILCNYMKMRGRKFYMGVSKGTWKV